jgi:hypothetical protein
MTVTERKKKKHLATGIVKLKIGVKNIEKLFMGTPKNPHIYKRIIIIF